MTDTNLQPGEHVYFTHPEAGQVQIYRMGANFPTGLDGIERPYFCAGSFYASVGAAEEGFSAACADAALSESVVDRRYELAEASMISPGVFED